MRGHGVCHFQLTGCGKVVPHPFHRHKAGPLNAFGRFFTSAKRQKRIGRTVNHQRRNRKLTQLLAPIA